MGSRRNRSGAPLGDREVWQTLTGNENINTEIIPRVERYDRLNQNHQELLAKSIRIVFRENIRGGFLVPGVGMGTLNEAITQRMNRILKANEDVNLREEKVPGSAEGVAPKDYVIRCSSAARDVSAFPHSYQWRTYLAGTVNPYGQKYAGNMPTLRNIERIEVIGAVVPNLNFLNPAAFVEPLLVVTIDEIDTLTSATYPEGNKILAELRLEYDGTGAQKLLHIKRIDNMMPRIFDKSGVISQLGQFTLNLRTFDGALLTGLPDDSFSISGGTGAGTSLTLTTTTSHGIVVGEKVIIVGYKTSPLGSLEDAVINRPFGHVVTAVTATTLTVNTAATGVGTGGYVLRSGLQFSITLRFHCSQ